MLTTRDRLYKEAEVMVMVTSEERVNHITGTTHIHPGPDREREGISLTDPKVRGSNPHNCPGTAEGIQEGPVRTASERIPSNKNKVCGYNMTTVQTKN